MSSSAISYKDAGVDIDAGNALVERIKPAVKATYRPGVMGAVGGFGGLFDLAACGYRDPLLVAGTDGVGTKLHLAHQMNHHETIGIDLVAMCVNDLLAQGAEPLFFLDYFACGALDVDQAEAVVRGIAEGCKQAGCALIGGETAEMPGMYPAGVYDLGGFAVGAVERANVMPRHADIAAGDALLAVPSSGVHSNGYSLVRKLLEVAGADVNDEAVTHGLPGAGTMGEIFLTPTRIYMDGVLPLCREGKIPALAHITGGGLTENIPRVLPEGFSAQIDLSRFSLPPLFAWLRTKGQMELSELLRTFNCGVGLVLVVKQADVTTVQAALSSIYGDIHPIGQIITAENAPEVRYLNPEAWG